MLHMAECICHTYQLNWFDTCFVDTFGIDLLIPVTSCLHQCCRSIPETLAETGEVKLEALSRTKILKMSEGYRKMHRRSS